MCGILGFVLQRPRNDERARGILRDMASALVHRGPDADGFWRDATGCVNFGHRRLSIIDLSSGGAQPMRTPDGQGVLIYNGEIYNFPELRGELEREGLAFGSRSDTEVLLAALYHWGPKRTLPRLNGMFAFAYWDARSRELVLARDRIGEKPLYYSRQGGNFYFASELKALRAHPDYRAQVNRAVLPNYFRLNYVPAPHTIYEETWKLPPGHWLRYQVETGRLENAQPYWSFAEMTASARGASPGISLEAAADEVEQLMRGSVRRRLVSDRPVGCFLSGGVDSSTVASLMQAVSDQRVQTFTIGYNVANLNEAEDAEKVARHLGTTHTTFIVQASDAMEMIPAMPDVYDEPYADLSQIPTCLLARLTARHVTVALTGDGGDEVFGGYNRYVWAREVWSRLQRLPRNVCTLLARGMQEVGPETWDRGARLVGSVLPSRYRIRSVGDKLHKIAYLAQAQTERDLYRRLVSPSHAPEKLCLAPGDQRLPFELFPVPAELRLIEEQMMYWDSLTYLPDDVLVKMDRAAMRFGLETRIPFLDNEVLRYAWSLPFAHKVQGGVGKLIVRKVLERYVPARLFERPKTGFGIPIGAWLRGPLKGWAEELLENPALKEYIRLELVREVWRQHQRQQRNAESELWSVLMFSAWLRRWHQPVPSQPGIAEPREAPAARKRGPSRGRVIFLLNSLVSAGAEKQVILTSIALAECDYQAEIYTLAPDSQSARLDSLLQRARSLGVYVHRPTEDRNWLWDSFSACRKSLRRDKECVLWTWGYRSDLVATLFLQGLAPRISSLRSASGAIIRQRANWWKLFDRGCARYVSNTQLNVDQLAEIIPSVQSRSRVLYNALEPEALAQPPLELPEQVDPLEIVMLGNIRVEKKGYDLAVEMMRRLRAEGRRVRLRAAGLPLERKTLEDLIARAEVGDSFELAGPVTDPFAFLRQGHVFLLLSRHEGTPNVLLEAMALGLPCISTRIGDVARFTRDGEHLRQIDIGDVEAACRAVREAQDDWPRFRKMGAAGQALVRREFSDERFKRNLEACVADLITARAARRST